MWGAVTFIPAVREDVHMSDSSSQPRPPRKGGATGRPPGKGGASGRPPGKGGASGRPPGKGGASSRPPGKAGMYKPPGRSGSTSRSPQPDGSLDRPRGIRVPEDITGQELDRRVLAELRTLPEGLAEQVAKLLVATSNALADEDFDLALTYAKEAKRKAGRVAVVREALGLAQYATGDYAGALAELRAVRRITGDTAHVPLMADCERGLDRPRKALELLAELPKDGLEDETRIEALSVEAGARRDLGQADMAVVILQVPDLNARRTEPWLARLRYAYADALQAIGREDDARTWFMRATDVDAEGLTDAADRVAEIDGVVFDDADVDDDADVADVVDVAEESAVVGAAVSDAERAVTD